MRVFPILALAGMIAGVPGLAHATDMLSVPTSGNDSLPVADSGFDWNGFYAGVFGAARTSPVAGGQLGLGIDAGVNARLEFVLVGAEVAIEGLGGATDTIYGQALGKAGIALTDSAILYGTGGIGASLAGPSESDGLLGGGVELALTNDVSVDARYLHGFALSGANPKDQITVGANFHF
ncbi:MAG TPA: porin family protein [Devosia sp.]|nr:porin family protein [Devosia sp.]